MSKKQRVKLINDFIDQEMKPLRDAIKSLQSNIRDEKNPGQITVLENRLRALRAYERDVVAEARNLQAMDYPTTRDVENFYETAAEHSKNAIAEVKGDRSLARVIIDTLKSIANFCIKVLTLGKVPSFFTTTGANLEKVEKATANIKSSLDKLVERVEPAQEQNLNP